MTTDDELIHTSENADAIQAGKDAVQISDRCEMFEGVPIAINGDGTVHVLVDVLQQMDRRAPAPGRRNGTTQLTELDSFIAHVNAEKGTSATAAIFAGDCKLRAVYNYYAAKKTESAAWRDHTAVYNCPLSEEWQAWHGFNGAELSQDQLASFLEDRSADIFDCDECKRIEIIGLTHDLQIYTKGTCKKQVDRTTGAHTLINAEEHGEGSTKIPQQFKLMFPVFVGGKVYEMFARLQLRIKDGRPRFTYKLQRAAEVKRRAFDEIRATVIEKTGLPVFAGSPEA